MRINADTVERLRERIAPLDTDARRQAYREGDIPRAEYVKDIDVRYRWDLYSLAWAYQLLDTGIGGRDEGLTSAHIDTALRQIVPLLGECDETDHICWVDDTTCLDCGGEW